MSKKVTPDNYPEIIEIYNSEGKTAAYDLIRSQFGIKNPTCVMKRMKQIRELFYNPESDRFETHSFQEEEGVFLDLNELCNKPKEVPSVIPKSDAPDRASAMEKMIHSLISDRLLEMSKYVILDPLDRHIIVDKTAMQTDGYKVTIS